MLRGRTVALVLSATLWPGVAQAQNLPDTFSTGPLLEDFGPVAEVPGRAQIPAGTTFKIAFDVGEASGNGGPNRSFVSVARFLNMHVKAGVPVEDIKLAVVVHGKAVRDLTTVPDNASAKLAAALMQHGVRFEVCGQSAAYYDVAAKDLLPGVALSLSAMTSHAVLQQQGYTLNPF